MQIGEGRANVERGGGVERGEQGEEGLDGGKGDVGFKGGLGGVSGGCQLQLEHASTWMVVGGGNGLFDGEEGGAVVLKWDEDGVFLDRGVGGFEVGDGEEAVGDLGAVSWVE